MQKRFTHADWVRWPTPLNGRIELIDGAAFVTEDDEVKEHLSLSLAGTLTAGGETPASGCGIVCAPDTVLQPSICLIDEAHAPTADEPWVADTTGKKRRVRIAIDVDCNPSRLEALLHAGIDGVWYMDCGARLFAYRGEAPPPWLLDALHLTPEQPDAFG